MRGGKALVATVAVFRDERKRRRNEVWTSLRAFLVIADIPLFRVRVRFLCFGFCLGDFLFAALRAFFFGSYTSIMPTV